MVKGNRYELANAFLCGTNQHVPREIIFIILNLATPFTELDLKLQHQYKKNSILKMMLTIPLTVDNRNIFFQNDACICSVNNFFPCDCRPLRQYNSLHEIKCRNIFNDLKKCPFVAFNTIELFGGKRVAKRFCFNCILSIFDNIEEFENEMNWDPPLHFLDLEAQYQPRYLFTY